jgi:nitrite reductase/ring-hydroxylating ferredoxin subunit
MADRERLTGMKIRAMSESGQPIPLCNAADLTEGGLAVPFDVVHGGQACRAFAVRFEGVAHAYLNRCTHVAMELDFQPDRFFDHSGQWLLCATHGAAYKPDTGECAGGPCRGGLVKIAVSERDGVVHWHTAWNLQPGAFQDD